MMKKLEKKLLKPWKKIWIGKRRILITELDEIYKFARTRDVPRCTLSWCFGALSQEEDMGSSSTATF